MRAPTAQQHNPPPDADVGEISQSYVQMVQHLIERCLLFYMDRDECAKALAKHANVKPIVTATVWNELEKVNKEFFVAYFKYRSERQARTFDRILEETTAKLRAEKLEDCTEKSRGNWRELGRMCRTRTE